MTRSNKGTIMKIAVYAICKNESVNVQGFLECAEEADYVVVCDTGSEDNTPQLIEQMANQDKLTYVEALFDPFNFSTARNFCLNQVPADAEYCVYLDLDERLEEGWIDKLRTILTHRPTHVTMQMVNGRDSSGNPSSTYYQTRCHRRDGYDWKYPCHEILQCHIPNGDKSVISSDIVVEHFPDATKGRDYLDLLKLGVEDYPDDQRALYYYGRELYYKGQYELAIEILDRACFAKDLWWDKQAASSMKHIAMCASSLGDQKMAETYFLRYLSYSTDEAEAWFDVAQYYYDLKQYHMALGYAKRCINLAQTQTKPNNFLFRDLSCWTWRPHDLAAYCSYHLQDYPGYAMHASIACKMNPNDERLQYNVKDALNFVTVVERTIDAAD